MKMYCDTKYEIYLITINKESSFDTVVKFHFIQLSIKCISLQASMV